MTARTKSTMLSLTWFVLLLLSIHNDDTNAFYLLTGSSSCHFCSRSRTAAGLSGGLVGYAKHSKKNHHNDDGDFWDDEEETQHHDDDDDDDDYYTLDRKLSISLLPTDQVVILPGETATIWTDEWRLVEECLDHQYGVLALGIVDDEYSANAVVRRMASLCEIQECDDSDDSGGMYLTLTCVGRIFLEQLERSYPYGRYRFSIVHDDKINDLKECNQVADNIEELIKALSRRSVTSLVDHADSWLEPNLLQRYKTAYGSPALFRHLQRMSDDTTTTAATTLRSSTPSTSSTRTTIQLLTAISWAVYTAVEDEILESYRLQALDRTNLFERLALAHFMLREKQLRHYGQELAARGTDDDNDNSIGAIQTSNACSLYTEGFQ